MHGRLDTVGWARAVQANDTAAHRLYRANRTAEETATVQANDAAAHRLQRVNRTAEEADVVQANNTAAHREQRTNRTADEVAVHHAADTCRKRVPQQAARSANDECEADDEDVEAPTGRRPVRTVPPGWALPPRTPPR